MLGEMAGKADQLPGQAQGQPQPVVARIQSQRTHHLVGNAVIRPAPDLSRHGGDGVFGQAERLADLTQG